MTGAPSVRVATWNIRAAIGPGEPFPPAWWRHVERERLERIGMIIGELDADVVALQEVAILNAHGDLLDQPAALGRMTDMHVRYAAVHGFTLTEPENGRAIGTATWGNAVLTRRPLEEVFATGLPAGLDDDLVEPAGSDLRLAGVPYGDAEPGAREPRCALGGRLAGDGPALSIVTAHLTYAGTEQRRAQATAIARLTDGIGSPAVVAGDFNAPIEAPELEPLSRAFVDAFAAVGVAAGDPRRASCGTHRIDHLLTRDLQALDCVVYREAGDASDHLPVVGTFEPKAPAGVLKPLPAHAGTSARA